MGGTKLQQAAVEPRDAPSSAAPLTIRPSVQPPTVTVIDISHDNDNKNELSPKLQQLFKEISQKKTGILLELKELTTNTTDFMPTVKVCICGEDCISVQFSYVASNFVDPTLQDDRKTGTQVFMDLNKAYENKLYRYDQYLCFGKVIVCFSQCVFLLINKQVVALYYVYFN